LLRILHLTLPGGSGPCPPRLKAEVQKPLAETRARESMLKKMENEKLAFNFEKMVKWS